ncbi:hypothetical protein THF1C08_310013 [Vibrio jasicida]|nr:hypothetical protein THF1C08_310013 [Vibrio jasicida]
MLHAKNKKNFFIVIPLTYLKKI